MSAEDAVEMMVKGALVLLAVAVAVALLVPFAIGYALTAVVWRISEAIINSLFPIRPDPAEIARHGEMLRRAREKEEREERERKSAKPLWQREEEAKEAARREAAASGPKGPMEQEEPEAEEDGAEDDFEDEEEPAREEQQEKEKPLDKNVYLERKLSKQQRDELAEREYKRLKISAFGDSGASYYLVKPRWNEGKEHAFFCFLIEAELKKRGKRAELHVNDGPDVVFKHNGHRYCIDVETGTNIARSREKVERKFGYYARDYYRPYIFVTKKKLKYKYSRYGIVVTRAKLKKVLKSVFD
ncbi:MAG: hypothetical protein NTX79_07600 [Candidatus Micrarchaeota archaeon]|nr:hypothetical protein [Candidatus Micrarchaeota archaeon]